MVKVDLYPSAEPLRRNTRAQAEWKVDTSMAFTAPPTSPCRRSFISRAALLVKVIARIEPGGTPRSRTRCAIRWVSTRVLPDPAPATIRVGPSVASTAWRWASFSPSSSSGEAWGSCGRAEVSIAREYTGLGDIPGRALASALPGLPAGRRPAARVSGALAVAGGALARGGEGPARLTGDARQQGGKLHRHDELGVRRRADLLQRLQVLQAHGVGVDRLGDLEDLPQRQREALRAQDRRLAVALCRQDRGPLLALRHGDGGLLGARGLGDHGAAGPLGRHLAGHGLLDLRRRDDLADLDVGDLDPQRSVTSSSLARRISFICSRLEST